MYVVGTRRHGLKKCLHVVGTRRRGLKNVETLNKRLGKNSDKKRLGKGGTLNDIYIYTTCENVGARNDLKTAGQEKMALKKRWTKTT